MRVFQKICFVLLAILFAAAALIAFAAAFFLTAEAAVDASARTLPSYAREDLSETLQKQTWSDEDYDLLYRQTGLGRPALDALKDDPDRILTFQDALFYDGAIEHTRVAITTQRDVMANNYRAPLAPLEDGDVLISSTCHTLGWRNGHAALLIDAELDETLESVSLGIPSTKNIGGTSWFTRGANFMVLRLKNADAALRAQIARVAEERLCDIPYSITVGLFSPKDQGVAPQQTHCSHLVWQAFYYFGYDIDADGGPICTARDIANSPYFEVVQVYGFDPLRLW